MLEHIRASDASLTDVSPGEDLTVEGVDSEGHVYGMRLSDVGCGQAAFSVIAERGQFHGRRSARLLFSCWRPDAPASSYLVETGQFTEREAGMSGA